MGKEDKKKKDDKKDKKDKRKGVSVSAEADCVAFHD